MFLFCTNIRSRHSAIDTNMVSFHDFHEHGSFHVICDEYCHIWYFFFYIWRTAKMFLRWILTFSKSPVYPYENHYLSARNGTKPEKEENNRHVQCPNYFKDGRIIDNSGARDVRTSVVDDIPESSNRFFVSLKHLDVVHIALPILHIACVVPRYHPAFIMRPYHCPYWAVMCLNREISFFC